MRGNSVNTGHILEILAGDSNCAVQDRVCSIALVEVALELLKVMLHVCVRTHRDADTRRRFEGVVQRPLIFIHKSAFSSTQPMFRFLCAFVCACMHVYISPHLENKTHQSWRYGLQSGHCTDCYSS